jgi:hypothetical protein
MASRWIEGNDIRLLENGEEFFPRVFACIANAKQEVILETFILFEDKVGLQLQEALMAAAVPACGRSRLRLARPVGPLHRHAHAGGRSRARVRPRQALHGLAHQHAQAHAPQDCRS